MTLSLTHMSSDRALRLLRDDATAHGRKAPAKLSGKGLSFLATLYPERLYVVNRNMFGNEHGLGPDDECSLEQLKLRGVKSVLLRVNGDRDLVTVNL